MEVIESAIIEFDIHLKNCGKSIGTRKSALYSILSFFRINKCPITILREDKPKGESADGRIVNAEEIKKALLYASPRTRAMILCLKDCGLRISDLVRLCWSDFEEKNGFWFLKNRKPIITKKRKIRAFVFFGEESINALENIKKVDERIFPTTSDVCSKVVKRAFTNAGVEGASAHSLRRFFSVSLKLPESHVRALMGKATGPYKEKRFDVFHKEYKENYNDLRVFEKESPTIKVLEQKIVQLEQQNEILQNQVEVLTEEELVKSVQEKMRILEEEVRALEEEYRKEPPWVEEMRILFSSDIKEKIREFAKKGEF